MINYALDVTSKIKQKKILSRIILYNETVSKEIQNTLRDFNF